MVFETGNPNTVTYVYDVNTGTYKTVTQDGLNRGFGCSAVVYNDSIILVGGSRKIPDARYKLLENGELGHPLFMPPRINNFPFTRLLLIGDFLICLSWERCQKDRKLPKGNRRNPDPSKVSFVFLYLLAGSCSHPL